MPKLENNIYGIASMEASTELDQILHSSNLDLDNRHTFFSIITPLDIFALRKV